MKPMKIDNQLIVSNNLASIFYSEVIKWRQYAAKSWSIIFLLSLIYADFTITNFEFRTFIFNIVLNLFSLQLWFFYAFIIIIYWILLSFYDRLFKVTPNVYSNNIEKFLEIFYSLGSLYLIFHFIATFMISLLIIKLNDYTFCNQSILFIIFFSCFTNFIQNINFLFNQTYLLYWPIQQQTKYLRFKAQFNRTFIDTAKNTGKYLLFWIVIYTFLRFNLPFESEESQFSIFSIKMLFVSLKISLIINLSNLISWQLYEIYMTEIYHFHIQPSDPSQLSLSMAVSLHNHPYIQVLGLIDFVDLSINNETKRKKLFSLSYPSSTPLNWNDLSEESINILKKFIDKFDFDDILHGSGSGLVGGHINDSLVLSKSPIKRFGGSPIVTRPIYTQSNKNNIHFLDPLIQNLKKSKFFSNIYNENFNYKNQHLFIDSLIICYTITALRNIVLASYNEDEYGVVQTNLQLILNTFIQLQKIFEKFASPIQTLNMQINLLQKDDMTQVDLIKQKLICTLNESLTKIGQKFGNSLKSLDFEESVKKRLERYCIPSQFQTIKN